MQMEMYLLEQTSDVYFMYHPDIAKEVREGGHANEWLYFVSLFAMDEENMKPFEKRLMSEVNQLRMIQDDISAMRKRLVEKRDEVRVPEWIMDPYLREEVFQILTYNKKFNTVDIRDTFLIPAPRNLEPGFDERLREQIDVDRLVEESHQELAAYANQRIPLPAKTLDEKDNDLLMKMNLVALAIKVDEPPLLGINIEDRWVNVEESLSIGAP
jgi:hypothetical protein